MGVLKIMFGRLRAMVRAAAMLVLVVLARTGAIADQYTFVRGDGNGDGQVQISDAIFALQYLFLAGPGPCLSSLDATDDGALNVADPIYVLNFLFDGGAEPTAPFPVCGVDTTADALDCEGPLAGCSQAGVLLGPLFPGQVLPTGIGTRASATGDVNGDGRIDVLTAKFDSGAVGVLLGNGDGTFADSTDYASGSGSDFVVVGDLNGDSDLDAVTNSSAGIAVILGNGDGSFATPAEYDAFAPESVALGDLDGDGDLDAVTRNLSSTAINVLSGNGDGSFSGPPFQFAAGFSPNSLELGDLNGDGTLDAVTSNATTIAVLIGYGDATFAPPVQYAISNPPLSLALGDVDADGYIDALTTSTGSIGVFLGNGDGTYAAPLQYWVGGSELKSLALGHVDGGDSLDAVLIRLFDSSCCSDCSTCYACFTNLVVLFGNGDGTFALPQESEINPDAHSTHLADLDADGNSDAVCVLTDTVCALMGNGSGGFGTWEPYPAFGIEPPRSIMLADLDEDNYLDMLAIDGPMVVMRGVGDGTLGLSSTYGVGGASPFSDASSFDVGDLNGDLFIDAVTSNLSGTIGGFLGNGDGTFLPGPEYVVGNSVNYVAIADLDGDGILDLAYVGSTLAPPYQPPMYGVLLGNGDGSFATGDQYVLDTAARSLALGDLDADGDFDAVTGWFQISVLLGNGDGTFGPLTSLAGGPYPQSVVLGDLDDDANLDIVIRNPDTIGVMLGTGFGTFVPEVLYAVGTDPWASAVALGDVDLDGDLDAVAPEYFSRRVVVLLGHGDGTLTLDAEYVTGPSPSAVALGDLDLDGDLEAVTGSHLAGACAYPLAEFSVMRNRRIGP